MNRDLEAVRPRTIKANRPVSLFDSKHRFNLTTNMELPFR